MTALKYLAATQEPTLKKRALVLSGGGMRLSYQAGAMLALEEKGLAFHHFDATSGGSMNMSMLFSGLSPKEMCKRWSNLNMMDSVSLLPLSTYLKPNQIKGVGDADGIRNNVFPHLGIDVEKINTVDNVLGTYNVLDYADKCVEVIPHTKIDTDMMIAGISLPGVFPPIKKNNKTYLDTAFIQDANLMETVKRGAEEIWLIWGLGNTGNYQGGALNIYIQMLETAANGSLNDEIKQIHAINQRISQGDSPYGQTQAIQLHIIQPSQPLPLDPDLYLGNITNKTLIEMGYADAKSYLKNKQANGLTLSTNNLTRMKEPEPGLRFCELQKGDLAFSTENKTTTLDITVHIHSFEKFMNNPSHKERITGQISINHFVEEKIIDNGYYFLTSNKNNAEMKIFNYLIEFTNNNKNYTLTGKKEIFDDPGFDFIADLSTVFTTLYEENIEAPIAKGELSLSLKSLASQATSIRTTHTDSSIESAKMITKFSAFSFLNKNKPHEPA